MKTDKLVITHGREVEEFEVESATIKGRRMGRRCDWHLSVEAKPGDHEAAPSIDIGPLRCDVSGPQDLGGKTLSCKRGADGLATFYYWDHHDLDDNKISIKSVNGDNFRVVWTARARPRSIRWACEPLTYSG